MPLVECVPYVSEGRRPEVIDRIIHAIRGVPGAHVLDVSSDASHNRSVITMVGSPGSLEDATLALYAEAIASIDLRTHSGAHPRLGAVDVVPFIPIDGLTMSECVQMARDTGARVAARFQLPVFLYEEAATTPARRNLAEIRRGEFEGLPAKLAGHGWTPDFGPATPHQSAGATVIGARLPLIAFNVNLATPHLEIAKAIATTVRHSSGGLPFVKALGVPVAERGLAQVSMNLTNYEQTPIVRAFEAVRTEAARHGVAVVDSEIVGLVPAAALTETSPAELLLAAFTDNQILENRIRDL